MRRRCVPRAALGEDVFTAIWVEGQTLSLEEAVALALEGHALVQ